MNKKPILLRSFFALVVLGVFLFSMYPLGQTDFYASMKSMFVNPADPKIEEVCKLAKAKQEADKSMYASTAIEEAAREKGVLLTDYVKPRIVKSQSLTNNRDVLAHARKLSAGSIRLGIDLNGGAEFLLELEPNETGSDAAQKRKDIENNFERYRDVAIETLRTRLESENIFESEISPAGGNLISLRVPIVSKEEKSRLERLIKMSARLSFSLVHPENDKLVQAYLADPENFTAPEGYKMMENAETGRGGKVRRGIYFVEREAQMDGKDISDAFPTMSQFGQREIILNFNPAGAQRFGEVTSKNVGRKLAIILDNVLYSAPNIQHAITGGTAQITGDFSREDAETISKALVSGSVPFKVKVQAQYDIDPTIGKETVNDGLWSGIAGTILVMIFMAVYYMRSGLVANISLIVNALLMLGAIAAFGVTLTLPGIAGIILTIGMAVDANVLIYERIREEIAEGKTVLNAIDIGFDKAFAAIFDSNITTLFVALILLWQGTGAIKGFAMTLAIGIFTTLFTAVFLTRLLFDLMTRFTTVKSLKMLQVIKPGTNINFFKYAKPVMLFFALLIVATFVTLGIRGRDALGIDFTGGTQIELDYQKLVPAEQIEKVLSHAGYQVKVNYKTPGSMASDKKKLEIILRDKHGAVAETAETVGQDKMTTVSNLLNKSFPDAKYTPDRQSTLGSLIGETFTKSAILSLALAILGMLIYMTIRFEFSYSIAANLGTLNDVIVSMGIFLMCGGELTLNVVAAGLTLLGYSINDTIVNFDRIRENRKLIKGMSYREIVNLSINQTLARTILTSVTVALVLIMQLCFGGAAIRDFVFVMLIGVVVGTISTIFVSVIIIAYWHKNDKGIPEDSAKPEPKKA